MVVCPFCGMSRPLEKKGSRFEMEAKAEYPKPRGRVRFNQLDPQVSPFIDFREALGGRGMVKLKSRSRGSSADRRLELEKLRQEGKTGGFRRVDSLNLAEAKDDPDYADLIAELRQQAKMVLEATE